MVGQSVDLPVGGAVSARLDEFEGRLETYMRDAGVPELSEDELKQLGLDVALDPAEWLAEQTT
jgi:hypothetical protein